MGKHLNHLDRNSGLTVEVTRHGIRLAATGLLGILGLLAALALLLVVF